MKNEEVKEIYSDGIGKIHFFGNMIRLDLMSFEPAEDDENGKPNPVVTNRIVMSPNAFLASYDSFVNMIKKLTDAGVLSKASEETAEAAETTEDPENSVAPEIKEVSEN